MIALLWFACTGSGGQAPAPPAAPEPIGWAECAVCGMVVSEQPAPRGQLAYRDGHHDHVCSIEELRALAQQPSARGRPVGIFVETLPSDFDLASRDTHERPWRPVEDVWFVFGAARPGVMGEPVLSFDDEATARRFADPLGTRAQPWAALARTPFHDVPR